MIRISITISGVGRKDVIVETEEKLDISEDKPRKFPAIPGPDGKLQKLCKKCLVNKAREGRDYCGGCQPYGNITHTKDGFKKGECRHCRDKCKPTHTICKKCRRSIGVKQMREFKKTKVAELKKKGHKIPYIAEALHMTTKEVGELFDEV